MVRETRHLWVGNLPDNIREERILEHFKRYGRVQSVKLLPKKEDEVGVCATVAFIDIKSASKAHSSDNKIDERTLKTDYYEPPTSSMAGAAIHIHERDDALLRSSSSGLYAASRAQRYPHGLSEERGYDRSSHYCERPPERESSYVRRPTSYHDDEVYRGRGRTRERNSNYRGVTTTGFQSPLERLQGHYRAHNSRQHFEPQIQTLLPPPTQQQQQQQQQQQVTQQSSQQQPAQLPPQSPAQQQPPPQIQQQQQQQSSPLPSQQSQIPQQLLQQSRFVVDPQFNVTTEDRESLSGKVSHRGTSPSRTKSKQKRQRKKSLSRSRSQSASDSHSRSGSRSSCASQSSCSSSNTRSSSSSRSSHSCSERGSRSQSPSVSFSSRGSSKASRLPGERGCGGIASPVPSIQSTVTVAVLPPSQLALVVPSQLACSTTSVGDSDAASTTALDKEDKRPLGICVRNLPVRSSDTSLKDGLFHEYKKHGKVTTVKVIGQGTDRYAVVCFKKPEDVEKALEVSKDKLFFGSKIEVTSHEGLDVEDNEFRPLEAELDEFHPKATRTLFIGNLEKDITTAELRKHFEQFGEIIEIDIKKQGAVSSYAFVQYSDIASVVKAMRKMDGEHLGANRIKLGFGKSMPTNCVWLDGIADTVSEKFLARQFVRFGHVVSTYIDRERGHALIFYERVEHAQIAVPEMRGRALGGKKLQIDFASRECQVAFFEKLEMSGQLLPGDRPWDRREQTFDARDERYNRDPRLIYETTNRPFNRFDTQQRGNRANFRGTQRGNFSSRGRGQGFSNRSFDEEFTQTTGTLYEDSYEQELREYGFSQRERRDYGTDEHSTRGFSPRRRRDECSLSPKVLSDGLGTSPHPRGDRSSSRYDSGREDDASTDADKRTKLFDQEKLLRKGRHRSVSDQESYHSQSPPNSRHQSPPNLRHDSRSISPPLIKDKRHKEWSNNVTRSPGTPLESPTRDNSIDNRMETNSVEYTRDAVKRRLSESNRDSVVLRSEFMVGDVTENNPRSRNKLDPERCKIRKVLVEDDCSERRNCDVIICSSAPMKENVCGISHLHLNDVNKISTIANVNARSDKCNVDSDRISTIVHSDNVSKKVVVDEVTDIDNETGELVDENGAAPRGIILADKEILPSGKDLKNLQKEKVHLLHLLEQLDDTVNSEDTPLNADKRLFKKAKLNCAGGMEYSLDKYQQQNPNELDDVTAVMKSVEIDSGENIIHRKTDTSRSNTDHVRRADTKNKPLLFQSGKMMDLSEEISRRQNSPKDNLVNPLHKRRKPASSSCFSDEIEISRFLLHPQMNFEDPPGFDPNDDELLLSDKVVRISGDISLLKSPESKPGTPLVDEPRREKESPLSLPLPRFATSVISPKHSPRPILSPKIGSLKSPLLSPTGNQGMIKDISSMPDNCNKIGTPTTTTTVTITPTTPTSSSSSSLLSSLPPTCGEKKIHALCSAETNRHKNAFLSPTRCTLNIPKSSVLDSSSDSEHSPRTSPSRPSLEERIRLLDEKYRAWSGSTRNSESVLSTASVDTTAKIGDSDKFAKRRPSFLSADITQLRTEPSDIVKSLLAKSSIFDQDSKRLEHINEKYEPREVAIETVPKKAFCFRTKAAAKEFSPAVTTSVSTPSRLVLSTSTIKYPFPSTPVPSSSSSLPPAVSVYCPPTISSPTLGILTHSPSMTSVPFSPTASTSTPLPLTPRTPHHLTASTLTLSRKPADQPSKCALVKREPVSVPATNPTSFSTCTMTTTTKTTVTSANATLVSCSPTSTTLVTTTVTLTTPTAKKDTAAITHRKDSSGGTSSSKREAFVKKENLINSSCAKECTSVPKEICKREGASSSGSVVGTISNCNREVKRDGNCSTSSGKETPSRRDSTGSKDSGSKVRDTVQSTSTKDGVVVKKENLKESEKRESSLSAQKRRFVPADNSEPESGRPIAKSEVKEKVKVENVKSSEPESKRIKLSSSSVDEKRKGEHSSSPVLAKKSNKSIAPYDKKTTKPEYKRDDKEKKNESFSVKIEDKTNRGEKSKDDRKIARPLKDGSRDNKHDSRPRLKSLSTDVRTKDRENRKERDKDRKDRENDKRPDKDKSKERRSSKKGTKGEGKQSKKRMDKNFFWEEEPVYFSMYDKVKARSSQNEKAKEKEKELESMREKFNQLKQSRAKREEKIRPASFESDSDNKGSDIGSIVSSETSESKVSTSASTKGKQQTKKRKLIIASDSEDSEVNRERSKNRFRSDKVSDDDELRSLSDAEHAMKAASRNRRTSKSDVDSSDVELTTKPPKENKKFKSKARKKYEKDVKVKSRNKSGDDTSETEGSARTSLHNLKAERKRKFKASNLRLLEKESAAKSNVYAREVEQQHVEENKQDAVSFSSAETAVVKSRKTNSKKENKVKEHSKEVLADGETSDEELLDKLKMNKRSKSKKNARNKTKSISKAAANDVSEVKYKSFTQESPRTKSEEKTNIGADDNASDTPKVKTNYSSDAEKAPVEIRISSHCNKNDVSEKHSLLPEPATKDDTAVDNQNEQIKSWLQSSSPHQEEENVVVKKEKVIKQEDVVQTTCYQSDSSLAPIAEPVSKEEKKHKKNKKTPSRERRRKVKEENPPKLDDDVFPLQSQTPPPPPPPLPPLETVEPQPSIVSQPETAETREVSLIPDSAELVEAVRVLESMNNIRDKMSENLCSPPVMHSQMDEDSDDTFSRLIVDESRDDDKKSDIDKEITQSNRQNALDVFEFTDDELPDVPAKFDREEHRRHRTSEDDGEKSSKKSKNEADDESENKLQIDDSNLILDIQSDNDQLPEKTKTLDTKLDSPVDFDVSERLPIPELQMKSLDHDKTALVHEILPDLMVTSEDLKPLTEIKSENENETDEKTASAISQEETEDAVKALLQATFGYEDEPILEADAEAEAEDEEPIPKLEALADVTKPDDEEINDSQMKENTSCAVSELADLPEDPLCSLVEKSSETDSIPFQNNTSEVIKEDERENCVDYHVLSSPVKLETVATPEVTTVAVTQDNAEREFQLADKPSSPIENKFLLDKNKTEPEAESAPTEELNISLSVSSFVTPPENFTLNLAGSRAGASNVEVPKHEIPSSPVSASVNLSMPVLDAEELTPAEVFGPTTDTKPRKSQKNKSKKHAIEIGTVSKPFDNFIMCELDSSHHRPYSKRGKRMNKIETELLKVCLNPRADMPLLEESATTETDKLQLNDGVAPTIKIEPPPLSIATTIETNAVVAAPAKTMAMISSETKIKEIKEELPPVLEASVGELPLTMSSSVSEKIPAYIAPVFANVEKTFLPPPLPSIPSAPIAPKILEPQKVEEHKNRRRSRKKKIEIAAMMSSPPMLEKMGESKAEELEETSKVTKESRFESSCLRVTENKLRETAKENRFDVFEFRDDDEDDVTTFESSKDRKEELKFAETRFHFDDRKQHHGGDADSREENEKVITDLVIKEEKTERTRPRLILTIKSPHKDSHDKVAKVETREEPSVRIVEHRVDDHKTDAYNAPPTSMQSARGEVLINSNKTSPATRKSQRLQEKSYRTTIDEVIEDVVKGNFRAIDEFDSSIIPNRTSRRTRSRGRLDDHLGPHVDRLEHLATFAKGDDSDAMPLDSLSLGHFESGVLDADSCKSNADFEVSRTISLRTIRISRSHAKSESKHHQMVVLQDNSAQSGDQFESEVMNKDEHANVDASTEKEKGDVSCGQSFSRNYSDDSRGAENRDANAMTECKSSKSGHKNVKEKSNGSNGDKSVALQAQVVMKVELPKVSQSTSSKALAGEKDIGNALPLGEKDTDQSPTALVDPVTGFLTPVRQSEEGTYVPATTTAATNTTSTSTSVTMTMTTTTSTVVAHPRFQIVNKELCAEVPCIKTSPVPPPTPPVSRSPVVVTNKPFTSQIPMLPPPLSTIQVAPSMKLVPPAKPIHPQTSSILSPQTTSSMMIKEDPDIISLTSNTRTQSVPKVTSGLSETFTESNVRNRSQTASVPISVHQDHDARILQSTVMSRSPIQIGQPMPGIPPWPYPQPQQYQSNKSSTTPITNPPHPTICKTGAPALITTKSPMMTSPVPSSAVIGMPPVATTSNVVKSTSLTCSKMSTTSTTRLNEVPSIVVRPSVCEVPVSSHKLEPGIMSGSSGKHVPRPPDMMVQQQRMMAGGNSELMMQSRNANENSQPPRISGIKSQSIPSSSPKPSLQMRQSPVILQPAAYPMPAYEAALQHASSHAYGSSGAGGGVIADLLQNPSYLIQHKDYLSSHHPSGQLLERVPSQIVRPGTPVAVHPEVAARLGNPTPPHTPTPPTHPSITAQADMLHIRHSNQPLVVHPHHPHVGIRHATDLPSAYMHQQLVYASHPHYASVLHPELRAQQAVALQGMQARMPYAMSSGGSIRHSSDSRSSVDSKSDDKEATVRELKHVKEEKVNDQHRRDDRQMTSDQILSSRASSSLGQPSVRQPQAQYPHGIPPLRQVSPHLTLSPHDRTTDSPIIANVYTQPPRLRYPHSNGSEQTKLVADIRTQHDTAEAIHSRQMNQASSVYLEPRGQTSTSMTSITKQEMHRSPLPPQQMSRTSCMRPPSPPPAHARGLNTSYLQQGCDITPTPQPASEAPLHPASHVVSQPIVQPRSQLQTPPHASQVPPQGDSLLMLLQRYPVMWQGLLALKNDQAAVQMHFVSGNHSVAISSLPSISEGGTPPLRIAQRMRLEQTQLEGVARRMQMEGEHCMLLALPCGRDHMDVLQQSNNLRNGFITYLQQKQAAGIVNVAVPGSQQPAYVVHIFPACDFSNENLARIAPDLLHSVADIAHLLIVIATV